MKKLIALALMSAPVASQAGIIADTSAGWFVSADQKMALHLAMVIIPTKKIHHIPRRNIGWWQM